LLIVLLAMLLIVALAAVIVVYVAFPHRGEELPGAAWLGEAMRKGIKAIPTLREEYADRQPGAHRR
jgi:hypothetical protein